MSIEATTWALNVPVGGNAKVVLLGLANHAHPDGTESYPALDTLAHYAHCHRNTARRNVRELVEDGWIIEDGYGPRGQTKYRLAMEGGTDSVPVPPASRRGTTAAVPEPSIEPSKAVDSARPPEVEQIFTEWNRATERSRTQLTAERRRIIQKAIASHGLDDCLAAVRNIGADRWARGENDRGRRFDDIEHALGSAKRIEHWRERTAPPAGVTHLRPNASAEERRMARQRERAEKIAEYDRADSQPGNNAAMIALYPTTEEA